MGRQTYFRDFGRAVKWGVAVGGSGLAMPEHLADEIEAVAAQYGDRREAVRAGPDLKRLITLAPTVVGRVGTRSLGSRAEVQAMPLAHVV